MNGVEGGLTKKFPEGKEMSIFDASEAYKAENTPLIVIAGKEYGTGSSRDWAAKGTLMLGVNAVITESYERIHRSNLVGMGVLPLQFLAGESADGHGFKGDEVIDIEGIPTVKPGQKLVAHVKFASGETKDITLLCRIDTANELEYIRTAEFALCDSQSLEGQNRMTRDEKMELIQRMLGLRHKLKVHDSMKSPETHDEQSVSTLARWDLEDEIKAIELLLERERELAINVKIKLVEKEYLSGKPRPAKKK